MSFHWIQRKKPRRRELRPHFMCLKHFREDTVRRVVQRFDRVDGIEISLYFEKRPGPQCEPGGRVAITGESSPAYQHRYPGLRTSRGRIQRRSKMLGTTVASALLEPVMKILRRCPFIHPATALPRANYRTGSSFRRYRAPCGRSCFFG